MPFITGGGSGGSVTAAAIEATFTQAGQTYIGTGSGTGALVNFASSTREALMGAAWGIKGQAWDPYSAAVGGGALTSQRLSGALCGLQVGDVVSNIILNVSQAASGTAPTGLFVGLYDTAGNLKASSNNLNANAIWTSLGYAVAPLSASFTVTTAGGYFLAALQNGAFGTTNLNVTKNTNVGSNLTLAGPSGLARNPLQNGQTTLPNPATFTAAAGTDNIWMGWS